MAKEGITPELISAMLPEINGFLNKGGPVWEELLQACNIANLPYDHETFPEICFDGSAANLPLVLAEVGKFNVIEERSATLFGSNVEKLTLHPNQILDKALDSAEELVKRGFDEIDTVFFTVVAIAINMIVHSYLKNAPKESHQELEMKIQDIYWNQLGKDNAA